MLALTQHQGLALFLLGTAVALFWFLNRRTQ